MAVATPVTERTRHFSSSTRELLINGRFEKAASGRTFDTVNPASGEVLASVAEGDAQDIDRAVQAARRAFESGPWSRMNPSERGRILHRIGDLIMEHADELAELDCLDNGKPLSIARAADIPLAADLFWYMAGWATKLNGGTINPSVPYLPGAEFHAYSLREPVGVVGQIIPWNFPLLMAAWKLHGGPQARRADTAVRRATGRTDARGRSSRRRRQHRDRVR
jgi:phenylacetaldehyde dehydrogenase